MKNEEDMVIDKQLRRMLEILNKIERTSKDDSLYSQYMNWIKDITQPSYNLITMYIKFLSEEASDVDNVLLILKKLIDMDKDNIVQVQIEQSKEFENFIVKYVTIKDIKKLNDTTFYFLSLFFEKETFLLRINKKLINIIFDALSIIKAEDVLLRVVTFLIAIETKETLNDILYKVHKSNSNSHVFDEVLLKVLHTEKNTKKVMDVLRCINKLMISENSSIFYEFDLECFIDIIVDKLNTEISIELKVLLLKTLEKITQYETYYAKLYKIEEITELMEDYQGREEQTEEVKKISKEIIVNIMEHQVKKKINLL